MRRVIALWLALLSAAALADEVPFDRYMQKAVAAAASAPPLTEADLPTGPDALALGAALYTARCVVCHGENGDGKGPASGVMNPAPASLSDAARWSSTSLATKLWIIEHGVRGTPMGPSGLHDHEVLHVLSYLHERFHPEARAVP